MELDTIIPPLLTELHFGIKNILNLNLQMEEDG